MGPQCSTGSGWLGAETMRLSSGFGEAKILAVPVMTTMSLSCNASSWLARVSRFDRMNVK